MITLRRGRMNISWFWRGIYSPIDILSAKTQWMEMILLPRVETRGYSWFNPYGIANRQASVIRHLTSSTGHNFKSAGNHFFIAKLNGRKGEREGLFLAD
ncbi:hypothetical protein [Algoriphagus namhaensis]